MNKSHTASDINLLYKYVKFTHFYFFRQKNFRQNFIFFLYLTLAFYLWNVLQLYCIFVVNLYLYILEEL